MCSKSCSNDKNDYYFNSIGNRIVQKSKTPHRAIGTIIYYTRLPDKKLANVM